MEDGNSRFENQTGRNASSLKFHDGALASPERAAKGDVKVGKRAKKIFKKTEEELRRWEN